MPPVRTEKALPVRVVCFRDDLGDRDDLLDLVLGVSLGESVDVRGTIVRPR
jgi:hypothetical protein